jgi:hypothetical protein
MVAAGIVEEVGGLVLVACGDEQVIKVDRQ